LYDVELITPYIKLSVGFFKVQRRKKVILHLLPSGVDGNMMEFFVKEKKFFMIDLAHHSLIAINARGQEK
jgi:hypothetical protein